MIACTKCLISYAGALWISLLYICTLFSPKSWGLSQEARRRSSRDLTNHFFRLRDAWRDWWRNIALLSCLKHLWKLKHMTERLESWLLASALHVKIYDSQKICTKPGQIVSDYHPLFLNFGYTFAFFESSYYFWKYM